MNSLLATLRFRRDHRWAPGQMSAFLDGELRAQARARLERHARDCPDCRGVLGSLRAMLALLHGLPEGDSADRDAPDIAGAVMERIHAHPER